MPSGISTSMFFRLWTRAPRKPQHLLRIRSRAARAARDTCRSPRRYRAVSEPLPSLSSFAQRAFEDDLAAVLARARAQIDDVVRRAHHVGIVLHHHDRVAQFAQFFQDADQPAGVAAVQSDGRLVQHVAGAHQPRAQTRGELDALRLAARERGRQPVEREIVQPDVVQELQPLPDLDQDLVGDRRLLRASVPARRRTPAPRRCSSARPRPGSCRPRGRTALPCAAARRGTPGRARSRGSGSGTRARAACTSCSPGDRRSGG